MKKSYKIFMLLIMLMIFFNVNIVKATDELPDNGGIITSSQVIQTKTGTGPWDDDDEAGNDSSEDNNIVRSFDQVTWTIENTMALNGGTSESYTGGTIYFKATLPDTFTSETIEWDLDSMAWIENATLSDDKMTLTGEYSLTTTEISVPGKQSLVFVAKVLGAANGTELKPEITLWLNGNSEDSYITPEVQAVTVSAAPSYNLKLVRVGAVNKRCLNLEYNGETIDGRIYGYSFILQLYNKNSSKGLKGIEYPTGDITFDLDLLFERTDLGSTEKEDITAQCTPILYSYKVADGSARWYVPRGTKSSDRKNSVYNSGNIVMTQNENKISVTVSKYAFDGVFPTNNMEYTSGSSIAYSENIGCFSVGYFEILIPDNDVSIAEEKNFYLTLKDSNFNATSISGKNITEQLVTSDDASTTSHVRYKSGEYSHYINLCYSNNTSKFLHSTWATGDSFAVKNQEFIAQSNVVIDTNNDPDLEIKGIDRLFKFDGEAFEVILYSSSEFIRATGMKNMTWKYYFVTKKDGTNWASQTEMNNGKIEDLNIYENIEEIPEGYVCIGVYIESQDGYVSVPSTGGSQHFDIRLKVKETAKIGQVYGFTQTSKYWTSDLDRSIYNQLLLDSYDTYPETVYSCQCQNYIKTEYDSNGNIVSGTHSGSRYYGQSILIVGAQQSISQKTIDDEENEKVNYDFSKNEYKVTYSILPVLSDRGSIVSNIKNVTVTITDTLPVGLTYVPNSCNYGEPEITSNADGTTTLVWKINNRASITKYW